MKKLLLCLGIAVFLTVGCGPGNMVSKAQAEGACGSTPSITSYKAMLRPSKVRFYVLNQDKFAATLKTINERKVKRGNPAVDVNEYLVGAFPAGTFAIVGIKNGCLVAGTGAIISEEDWPIVLKGLDLTEGDFSKDADT